MCLVPGADWPRVDSSDTREGGEPAGLPGDPGLLISANLVVAVMGRWGVATGAACTCRRSEGGEIFPCTNTDCSGWTKLRKGVM